MTERGGCEADLAPVAHRVCTNYVTGVITEVQAAGYSHGCGDDVVVMSGAAFSSNHTFHFWNFESVFFFFCSSDEI